ncbi:MAG TPA: hypothetical protein DD502_14055, partial [Cupriavidus sp.]|nr:hypothetical protein [Cupriavidus sp.]
HLVGQAPQRIVPEVLGLGRIAPPAAVTGAIGAIGTIGAIGAIDVTRPSLGDLLDPVIWSGTVTLPDVAGKPARLAIREFERYYTDRTVPEVRAGKSLRRRVVEERLVYTTFFPLA